MRILPSSKEKEKLSDIQKICHDEKKVCHDEILSQILHNGKIQEVLIFT